MELDTPDFVSVASASLILLALLRKKQTTARKNRRIWVRSWISRRPRKGIHNLVEELKNEDEKAYKNYLRMDESTFLYILNKISPIITKQTTHLRKPIPPKTRLLATLRFLATGESYTSLQYSLRIPQCTLSLIVPETCIAIYEAFKDTHLKIPDTESKWQEVAQSFEDNWNVVNCIGALDGKHVRINCPSNSGSHFFNYKLYNSIVLLALVDANYKFLYVDAGTNGRVGDSGVYAKSKLRRCLNERSILNIPSGRRLPGTDTVLPCVVLADDAFPLSYNLMKPYPLRNISREEKIFNYRLSRGRRVVESAFGILASRFRVLLTSINLSPEKAKTIVLASCTLHNILIDKKQTRYFNQDMLENNNWSHEIPSLARQQRQSVIHGAEIRNHFKEYYNGIGRVPWQDDKV